MFVMTTPKSWPDDSWPTPEQLGDWLGRCTPEERIAFATGVLAREERLQRALVTGAV